MKTEEEIRKELKKVEVKIKEKDNEWDNKSTLNTLYGVEEVLKWVLDD